MTLLLLVEDSSVEVIGLDDEVEVIGPDDEVLLFIKVVSTVGSEVIEDKWTVTDWFWVLFLNGATEKIEKENDFVYNVLAQLYTLK